MKHNGIADPDQLAMLTRVLNNYCVQSGILSESPEREHIAATLIALYERGITEEQELTASLPIRNPPGQSLDGEHAQPAGGSEAAKVTSTKTTIDRR